MALTPTANWLRYVTPVGARRRVLATIYDGTTTWKALSGSCDSTTDLAGVDAGVRGASSVAYEIDLTSRKASRGDYYVDFADAWLRPILVANRLRGKKLCLYLGAAELNETDFLQLFYGVIHECSPQPSDGEPIIRVSAKSGHVLLDTKIRGPIANMHPGEILETFVLGRADVAAGMIDDATFEPDYFEDIQHFCVSYGVDRGTSGGPTTALVGGREMVAAGAIQEPTKAGDVADEICKLAHLSLLFSEDGKFRLHRYDPEASAVDSWTEDDVLPKSIAVKAIDNNMINRVAIGWSSGKYGRLEYVAEETASRAAYEMTGLWDAPSEYAFDTQYLDSRSMLSLDVDQDDTEFRVIRATHGFCGFRDAYPFGSQPESAELSESNPAYWMISAYFEQDEESAHVPPEIVEVTAIDVVEGNYGTIGLMDMGVSPTVAYELTFAHMGDATVERSQRGTSARAWEGVTGGARYITDIWDITLAVFTADAILARQAYGCPVITVRTGLQKAWLQVGDLITFSTDKIAAYGLDGVSSSEKWEIIGKELDALGDVGINWTLALVNDDTTTQEAAFRPSLGSALPPALRSTDFATGIVSHVKTGCVVSDEGGLDIAVSAGMVGVHPRDHFVAPREFTLTASKDNYVIVDVETGNMSVLETVVAAGAPDLAPEELLLGKVTTNGSDIVSIDDERIIAELDGGWVETATIAEAQLATGSVTEGKIGALAVTTGKIGPEAVIEGKIYPGSVTETKIGALAVTEGKIGALAVTTGKIGPEAVIEGKIYPGSVTATKIGTAAVTAPKVADQVVDDQHVYQKRVVACNPNPNLLRYR